jgi:hypothetical protein
VVKKSTKKSKEIKNVKQESTQEVRSMMGLGMQFQSFVSSSSVTLDKNESSSTSSEDEEEEDDSKYCMPISDQELFKACGGRTARKGARGATQKGKLFRTMGTGALVDIEDSSSDEDEERLRNIQNVLESMAGGSGNTITAESSNETVSETINTEPLLLKKESKKRKQEEDQSAESSKKKKKKSKKSLSLSGKAKEENTSSEKPLKKKKKDKKAKKDKKKTKKSSSD